MLVPGPAAGARRAKGSTVDARRSPRSRRQADVPDVTASSDSDAVDALAGRRLQGRARPRRTHRPGRATAIVLEQTPAAGEHGQEGHDGDDHRRPLQPDHQARRRDARRPRRRRRRREGRGPRAAGARPSTRSRWTAARRCARAARRPATRSSTVTIERDGAWRHDGEDARARARRRPARRRRRLPGAARPVRRGRHGPGAARAARRRRTSAPACSPSALCMDKVVFKDLMARGRRAAGRLRGCARRGPTATRPPSSPARAAGVRQAGAAGLVGRASSRRGARPTSSRRRSTSAFAHDPRVIVEATRAGLEVECSVLGQRRRPRPRSPARSCCSRAPAGTTTRPSTPRAGWSCMVPGAHLRRGARARARAGRRRVRARRLRRPGARRLLRRRRRRAASTSSTRCPASPRRASTRSCGRRAACRTRSCCDRCVALALERARSAQRAHAFYRSKSGPRRSRRAGRRRQLRDPDEVVAVALAAGVELEALMDGADGGGVLLPPSCLVKDASLATANPAPPRPWPRWSLRIAGRWWIAPRPGCRSMSRRGRRRLTQQAP